MTDDKPGRIALLVDGLDVRTLPLTAREGFVLSRIDGYTMVRDIAGMCGLDTEAAYDVIDHLVALGAVRWKDAIQGMPQTPPFGVPASPVQPVLAPPPAKGPARARTVPPPAGHELGLYPPGLLEEDVEIEFERRREILDTYFRLDKITLYTLLGVTDQAERKDIRGAYFELSKRFHPDTMFRKRLGSYKPKMEAIFKKLTEAYDILSKPATRNGYDEYLKISHVTKTTERELHEGDRFAKLEARKSVIPLGGVSEIPMDGSFGYADFAGSATSSTPPGRTSSEMRRERALNKLERGLSSAPPPPAESSPAIAVPVMSAEQIPPPSVPPPPVSLPMPPSVAPRPQAPQRSLPPRPMPPQGRTNPSVPAAARAPIAPALPAAPVAASPVAAAPVAAAPSLPAPPAMASMPAVLDPQHSSEGASMSIPMAARVPQPEPDAGRLGFLPPMPTAPKPAQFPDEHASSRGHGQPAFGNERTTATLPSTNLTTNDRPTVPNPNAAADAAAERFSQGGAGPRPSPFGNERPTAPGPNPAHFVMNDPTRPSGGGPSPAAFAGPRASMPPSSVGGSVPPAAARKSLAPGAAPRNSMPPADPKTAGQDLARQLAAVRGITGGMDPLTRHINNARAAEKAGNLVEAANTWRLATAVAPQRQDVQLELERIKRALALQMAPVYEKQAKYEEENGRWKEASNSWAAVCEGKGDDPYVLLRCVEAHLRAGAELRRAQKFATKIVELLPENAQAHATLARVFIAFGMKTNAKRELETAGKLDPTDEMVKTLLKQCS